MHTRADYRAPSDPHVIPNLDRHATLKTNPSLGGAHRVRRSIDLHRRTEQHARADQNRRYIQDDTVEVKVDLVAECDIATIVAVERRFDPDALTRRGNQLPDDAGTLVGLVSGCIVKPLEKSAGAESFRRELRIKRIIEFA